MLNLFQFLFIIILYQMYFEILRQAQNDKIHILELRTKL